MGQLEGMRQAAVGGGGGHRRPGRVPGGLGGLGGLGGPGAGDGRRTQSRRGGRAGGGGAPERATGTGGGEGDGRGGAGGDGHGGGEGHDPLARADGGGRALDRGADGELCPSGEFGQGDLQARGRQLEEEPVEGHDLEQRVGELDDVQREREGGAPQQLAGATAVVRQQPPLERGEARVRVVEVASVRLGLDDEVRADRSPALRAQAGQQADDAPLGARARVVE